MLKKNRDKIKDDNNLALYAVEIFIYVILALIERRAILTSDAYYKAYSAQIEYTRILDILELQKKFEWLIFIFIPLFITIKFILVYFCIYTYCAINKLRLNFKTILTAILHAEAVFILLAFIKTAWFLVFNTNYDIFDVTYFSPLSLLNLVSLGKEQSWLNYALKSINLTEIIYVIILSYILSNNSDYKFSETIKFTAKSYGTGLILWILVVTFVYISTIQV